MNADSDRSADVYSFPSQKGYALQYTATENAIRLYGHAGIEEMIDGTADEQPVSSQHRVYAAVVRDHDAKDALVILRDLRNFGIHVLLESEYQPSAFADGL